MSKTDATISTVTDEHKAEGLKSGLAKFDHELYSEEDDIAMPVVRVKKINLPNKGSRWKVMADAKVVFIIESNKISKKEKAYLDTVEGLNFILAEAKIGIKSLNNFRQKLKKLIK